MHGRFLLSIALTGVVPALAARAQSTVAIEVGASRVGYEGASGFSLVSVTPMLEWLTPTSSLTANGSFAQLASGGWNLQGTASASVFTPPLARLRLELAGAGVGSTHEGGAEAGEVLGRGRLHWIGDAAGVWVGGAFGRAWNGLQWQTDRRGEAGAWFRRGTVTLTGTAAPTWLGDSLRFLDADVTARLAAGPVDLTAFAGARRWSRPTGASGSAWGGASAALWIGPHVAAVAAGGSYPTDYAQGFPAGGYLSLGLRLASRRSAREAARPVDARLRPPGEAPAPVMDRRLLAPVVASFEVQPSGAGMTTFRARAPRARRVELAGDFTQWRLIALQRAADGSFAVTLPVERGMYRMNLRVDDGAWGVPPGVPTLADEFGGVVGVLQIGAP